METLVNDIIKGMCCELCNQSFEHPKMPLQSFAHGYPAVCHDCWNLLDTRDRKDHHRAMVKIVGG